MSKDIPPSRRRIRGTKKDDTFGYATTLSPNLEQWRRLAAEWLVTLREGKSDAMKAMKIFLIDYIHAQGLEANPAHFFNARYRAPCLHETCLAHFKTYKAKVKLHTHVTRFLTYVLEHYFSVENDEGRPVVPAEFKIPIPPMPNQDGSQRGELPFSDKNVLPYRFIRQLREIVCPVEAKSFKDWKWAQAAEDSTHGGSWFVVSPSVIDENDLDCVWREREATKYEREKFGYSESIYEIWSPVRAVALYVKLQLPLRVFQVRMLDSGEADTHRYERGGWIPNKSAHCKGTDKNPYRRGVFRQMTDGIHNLLMTGLFINTNKSADKDKDEWTRGYSIPWQHPDVLRWLEKLRDWQEKYNPISGPTPWTELDLKHLGDQTAEALLKSMGSTCFLFRDAAATDSDRSKPFGKGPLDSLWFKLLAHLEQVCLQENARDLSGAPLVFVKPGSNSTTYYPLHALRVSLITAFALEGGVPLTVLSKCIAGHARLVMTLYYTKAGVTYCTEVMDSATKRLLVNEQENYVRWLKDKTYEQLEASGAYYDPAAIHAVMRANQCNASLLKDDKGLCPRGGWGCDSGGVYINEDSGQVTYGEVPGYPQKNCVRCRWFFTGPAFLDGLQNHWNNLELSMADLGERILKMEGEITALEDELYECEVRDQPFMHHDRLNTLRILHQADYERNNKTAEDLSATHRLIMRCRAISRSRQDVGVVQLVAVGALDNVEIAINECGKLHQILTAVAGSVVYPEHDVSKAILQAGKAFDMMLAKNGREPFLFKLDESELSVVVQHITKLLATEAGSIKSAVHFVEGRQRLAQLGLDSDIARLAQEMAAARVVQLPDIDDSEQMLLA
ncbi:integrase family protein [Paraburkholderia sp. BCC1884]|uniref:gamma-mobile-trio integrase GmtZ n=1 Tax=Paraburkholderia sp. BCC1884 TaxID=2562668 RepID=UPI001182E002|nr:integrase family protein [Paraburkholderia sp. BCC1884]